MERAVVWLVGATVVALVSGCGGSPAPLVAASSAGVAAPTSVAPTPSASPAPSAADDATVSFLLNVRHSPTFAGRSDEQLLTAATAVCAAFDGGATFAQGVQPLLDDGATGDDAMLLASTAVFEFCPAHDSIIEVALGGPANPQPDPTGSAADQYLAAVHTDPFFGDSPDEMVTMLGTTMCDGFTRGDSFDTTIGYLGSMPPATAMVLLRAATTYICPQHAGILTGH